MSMRALKSLMVGIGSNKLNTFSSLSEHVFDSVTAATTHTDHFNHGVHGINFLQDFVGHG